MKCTDWVCTAKEEAEETIQGKPNQEEVEDSYLNLVNAIQSLQKK